jgi:hypothetical protein
MNFKWPVIISVLVAVFAPMSASATVITFEPGTGTFATFNPSGSIFALGGGFIGTITSPNVGYVSSSLACTPACPTDGTAAYYGIDALTITRADNSTFSLTSLDAAAQHVGFALNLTVTAGVISQTITETAGNANSFQTFSLTGFDNITSFTLSDPGQFAVDNITFSSAVPEASSWAMMILGFCGLGFLAHRRKNKTGFSAA